MPSPTLILIVIFALIVLSIVGLMFRALHIAARLVEQHSLHRQRSEPVTATIAAPPAAHPRPVRRSRSALWVLTAGILIVGAVWLFVSNANAATISQSSPAVPAHSNLTGYVVLVSAVIAAAVYIVQRVRKRPKR